VIFAVRSQCTHPVNQITRLFSTPDCRSQKPIHSVCGTLGIHFGIHFDVSHDVHLSSLCFFFHLLLRGDMSFDWTYLTRTTLCHTLTASGSQNVRQWSFLTRQAPSAKHRFPFSFPFDFFLTRTTLCHTLTASGSQNVRQWSFLTRQAPSQAPFSILFPL